jgi:hypothetical protein
VVDYPDHAGLNGDAVDCGVERERETEREKQLYGWIENALVLACLQGFLILISIGPS